MTTKDLYCAMALLESSWPVRMDGSGDIQAVVEEERSKCYYVLGYEPTEEDLKANGWKLKG